MVLRSSQTDLMERNALCCPTSSYLCSFKLTLRYLSDTFVLLAAIEGSRPPPKPCPTMVQTETSQKQLNDGTVGWLCGYSTHRFWLMNEQRRKGTAGIQPGQMGLAMLPQERVDCGGIVAALGWGGRSPQKETPFVRDVVCVSAAPHSS